MSAWELNKGVCPAQEILELNIIAGLTFLSCGRARKFKFPLAPCLLEPLFFLTHLMMIDGPSQLDCIAIRLQIFFLWVAR
jgi:hypothetical protein